MRMMWMAGVVLTGSAFAQQPEDRRIAFGKEVFKTKATCQFCHRWDGNGDQGYGGLALSLRKTELTHDQLVETIRCGRPGTGMPYHDQFAYTDKRCYDSTKADMGDQMPPRAVEALAPREIDAIAIFLEARVKGQGPATLADCEFFFGPGTKECDQFKK